MRRTIIHHHDWELLAYVVDAPGQEDGVKLTYRLHACRGCGWAAPEPSENYLMSDPDHRDHIENLLAEQGLRMCWNEEES